MRVAGEIFLLQFCIIWVNLRNLADFLPIEEKICIFPFFHHLSIIFFPNMLFGHILVKQKNIHPCYNTNAQTEMHSRHKDLYIWLDQKQRTYFRGSRARRGTSIISWSRGPYPSTLRPSPLKLGRRESNVPRTHPSMGHGLGIDGRGDLAVPVPPNILPKKFIPQIITSEAYKCIEVNQLWVYCSSWNHIVFDSFNNDRWMKLNFCKRKHLTMSCVYFI